MSEREFQGLATIRQLPPRGMITVRGDLAGTTIKEAVTGTAALDMPGQGACNFVEDRAIAWMSRDELLVMGPHGSVTTDLEKMNNVLAKDGFHLLTDVSDARCVFQIQGPAVRDVIAKLCPVDLRPSEFPVGKFRRTRLAQVPCAFWFRDETTVELIAFRSVADYVWDVLCVAANADANVGYFA